MGILRQHVATMETPDGPQACIMGSGVPVRDIVIWHEKLNLSVADIVAEVASLTEADIYAALAYYRDHRDDIERTIPKGSAFIEESCRRTPAPLLDRFTQKLRAASAIPA